MGIKSSVNEEAASSFTSMIDIVFLLLIFFILQPFKEPENKLSSDLPQEGGSSSASAEVPLKDINIYIGRDGKDGGFYQIGEQQFKGNANVYTKIAAELKRQSGGNLETPIAILPMSDVNFEHVLRALDGCYEAKMPKVKFGGNSPRDKK